MFDLCIDAVEAKLEGILKQWLEFEEQLDKHTKWFRTTEAIFRDQQLQASLAQKEAQLIISRERDILLQQKRRKLMIL